MVLNMLFCYHSFAMLVIRLALVGSSIRYLPLRDLDKALFVSAGLVGRNDS
jgi:hypothetical protein